MKREDMKAAAKFRVECADCGRKSPRIATYITAAKWMASHEHEHRIGSA